MRVRGWMAVVLWAAVGGTAGNAGAALSLLDRPVFVIRDQTFRTMVRTAPGTPPLEIRVPETLALFSRRRVTAVDTVQRFYFRARQPGPAPVVFRGGDGDSVSVDLEVLSWEAVLESRRFGAWEIPRI